MKQTAYKGMPLYYFAGDRNRGMSRVKAWETSGSWRTRNADANPSSRHLRKPLPVRRREGLFRPPIPPDGI